MQTHGGPVVNRAAPPKELDVPSAQIPDTTEGLENELNDATKVMARIQDGTFPEFIKAYAAKRAAADPGILAQVRDETNKTLTQWLKDNQVDLPRLDLGDPTTAPGTAAWDKVNKLNSPHAVGVVGNGVYQDKATFFQDIAPHNVTNGHVTKEARERFTKVRNWSEKIPSEGGFLVPEEIRSEILRVSLATAIMRPRARVVPMGSLRLSFPTLDSSSNVSSVFGGVVAYWTAEGAALTASQATFGRVTLEAKKLTAYAEVPNELVNDWGGLGTFLDEIFPEAVAWYEDLAFISGSGVGEPLGILSTTNAALITIAKEAGQTAATVVWENVIEMYSRMLPSSLGRAIWLASPDVFSELATMALAVGTGGSAVWLTDAHNAPQLTLLGRPVIMTEKAPGVVGSQGDLSFVDPGMYLIGDRQTMTAESSSHYKFGNDLTAYRVIQRVDGRPWIQSAITPKNNSASLSPFVQLAVRA
jgi:HK97 family phage major capsid protein